MDFFSDNASGASPEILAALKDAAVGSAAAYGEDAHTSRVEARLKEIFETDLTYLPVTTGTAANALALSALSPPYGAIYSHQGAHIAYDECGAPEFFTGGAKIIGLPGLAGKLNAEDIEMAVAAAKWGGVHHVSPAAVSVTQASEAGTCYSVEELEKLGTVCRRHKLRMHMDGARFANALAFLDAKPSDVTWRIGVDVLSFGATKNGALVAEALVVFDKSLSTELAWRRKRAGQLLSKMRFVSVQFEAYLTDDLWLRNARHANAMAALLSTGLSRIRCADLRHPVESNEVFIDLPRHVAEGLRNEGFRIGNWPGEGSTLVRLVAAFNTRPEDVTAFVASAERLAASGE